MAVKTRNVEITTWHMPSSSSRLPPDVPDVFNLTITDNPLGGQVEYAFRRGSDERFESAASHAAAHQLYQDETTVHAADTALFKKLLADRFFDVKKPRMEPEEQTFNLLRGIQKALPDYGVDSFFTKDGLGGRLLAEVVENHKPGPQLGEHLGGGQASDYLRRIGSLLPFMPGQDRIKFLAGDVPRLLKESGSYLGFLEKTASYLPKSQ